MIHLPWPLYFLCEAFLDLFIDEVLTHLSPIDVFLRTPCHLFALNRLIQFVVCLHTEDKEEVTTQPYEGESNNDCR